MSTYLGGIGINVLPGYRAEACRAASRCGGHRQRNLAQQSRSRGRARAEYSVYFISRCVGQISDRFANSRRCRRHPRQDHDDGVGSVGVYAGRASTRASLSAACRSISAAAGGPAQALTSSSKATNTIRAFFDKGPKFLHYRPEHVILTSVEFDHADIYRDLDHLKSAFARLIDIIPADGSLVVCGDYPAGIEIAAAARCRPRHLRGYRRWRLDRGQRGVSRRPKFFSNLAIDGKSEGRLEAAVIGMHNVKNALAVYVLGANSRHRAGAAAGRLRNLRRRQAAPGNSRRAARRAGDR